MMKIKVVLILVSLLMLVSLIPGCGDYNKAIQDLNYCQNELQECQAAYDELWLAHKNLITDYNDLMKERNELVAAKASLTGITPEQLLKFLQDNPELVKWLMMMLLQ